MESPQLQFPADYSYVLSVIDKIDPVAYGRTRNFINGAVTRLSPYISRGVISTRFVYGRLIANGHKREDMITLIRELAWRDFFQQVSRVKDVTSDVRNPQRNVASNLLPVAVVNATTGIDVIDSAIHDLYESGYLHNHLRMYLASIVCNTAQTGWPEPARWMYYHLLDGDLASNHLSWQWVCGSFSSKKYFVNQDNINHYTNTSQRNTFLDKTYAELPDQPVPEKLQQREGIVLKTQLPDDAHVLINPERATLVYNYYNLDPNWHAGEGVNRILLLEPELFAAFPVSSKCLEFSLNLANAIPGMQVFVGSFDELKSLCGGSEIRYKEHPLNRNYRGVEESREWLVPEATGYFPSFFAYWKRVSSVLGIKDHERKAH